MVFSTVLIAGIASFWRVYEFAHYRPPLIDVPAIEAPSLSIEEVIGAAARHYGVDPLLVKAVMAAESGFRHQAVSTAGAVGLMQLMPATAHEMGFNPMIASDNVFAGARYLAFLLGRYARKRDTLRWAIAAYNAGPGSVDRYRGIPPFRETRTYVKRVLGYYSQFRRSGRIITASIETASPQPAPVMTD
ncbi:MAG: lytic transglycosylase domain-containing protein [Acidobacteria bacterium]|nr:lytic transglycosylase domain-containing protein [Acidobacteriota bacterium]MBI3279210.1 lytic transglycosylase domain-containing protein [Acidobacteriota bacterium]